jgi:hypothetical protein
MSVLLAVKSLGRPILILPIILWILFTLALLIDRGEKSAPTRMTVEGPICSCFSAFIANFETPSCYGYTPPPLPEPSASDSVTFRDVVYPSPITLPPTADPEPVAGGPNPLDRNYRANPNNIHSLPPDLAGYLIDPTAAARALAREAAGDYNRLISMSVYGSATEYWLGAVDNARLVRDHWAADGWRLRLYHDDQLPLIAQQAISALGAETILMQQHKIPDHAGNLWRFHPLITDPMLTRLIVRDVDARMSERDLAAVREWIKSDKMFHVMRDNVLHTWPVMAGMWGTVGGLLNATVMAGTLGINPPRVGYFGDDQTAMREVVWPHVSKFTLCHDSYHCLRFGLAPGGSCPKIS